MTDKTTGQVSKKICAECEDELKEYAKLCLPCLDNLKNDKYEDFAFVMASLNNTLHQLMLDNENLKKENEKLKNKNDEIQMSKILNIDNI